ncbi:MAG: TonB-dependent receptor domain-containing protein [Erythrobacter sp.]
MKKFHSNSMKVLAFSASAIAFVSAAPAFAQDAEPGDECLTGTGSPGVVAANGDCVDTQDGPSGATTGQGEQVEVSTDASGQVAPQGGITVTGSRIVRDTYSSISPLQVLSTENQQSVGAFDPAQILQRSESAAGQQIDATFQGFVLDNGPGSQTLNLRGLGADRTLLLVNGRRLAPAGVEGAPTNPSINLVPSTLVDRYDLLLDGASSVYGSDAVAGVGNIILRKDFDGLELQANGNINDYGGGDDYQVSAAWGFSTDRAFFGIGAEYAVRDEVRLADRPFLAGCVTDYEITDSGEIRNVGIAAKAIVEDRTPGVTVRPQECVITSQVGRIFSPFQSYGSIYFTEGPGNSGITNYDESTIGGVDIDADGDGFRDVDFSLIDRNGSNPNQVFISEQKLYNVFAYGEYTFPGEANLTPFFEANYTRADIQSDSGGAGQIFPTVPGSNPFNPCNIANNDCAAAEVTLLGRPGANAGFSLPVLPIFSVVGDRDNFDVQQEQYRGVLGLRGDLPFIGSSWTFEVAGTYSRSEGSSVRFGIREDKLAFALGIDPTADFDGDGVVDNNGDGIADDYDQNEFFPPTLAGGACDAGGLANPDLALGDLTQGCVPVNLFSASLLGTAIGDFETQAERDYLFGVRGFDTTYEQTLISGFVTGDLFDLPAGPVGVVLGAEWREDSIESNPNDVAANGLFFAFFADRGASGSKWIREAFGELDIPLQAGKPWVEELTLNISGRVTDEEFYGTAGTYSIKGGWRPVSPLLFKFSYGTSFRAPNLRENFLQGQTGFPTIFDPCAVPNDAFVTPPGATSGAYDPALDMRDANVIANCQREGRDPFSVGIDTQSLNTVTTTSVEDVAGGTFDLDPETSRSITTGFAFEESFPSGFDFSFNFNYYDIKLKDSIIEPSVQFIINDCFTRDDGVRSAFCDRLTYGGPGARFLITDTDSGFINLNTESVRGIDLNTTFGYPVSIGSEVFDLQLNLRANHLIERSTLFIDDNGNESFDEDAGEFGFPSWTGRATLTADWKDFRFTWQTRYVGDVEQQEDGIDPLDDAFGNLGTGFAGDTCTGLGPAGDGVNGDGVFCRDIGFADEYFEHTASLRWDNGTIRLIAGITNIFNETPPLVDCNEAVGNFTCVSNVPIGNGYDLDGREFFGQLLYRF